MTQKLAKSRAQTRPPGRVLSARKIEHLLDWAEPIIRRACRKVWRDKKPRGLELADLRQEARIAVFLAADQISTARRPAALTATIATREAYDAVRVLSTRRCTRGTTREHQPARGQAQSEARQSAA